MNKLTIDHSAIPAAILEMELANAQLSPDAQVFPWRDQYPTAGSTVYSEGQFWTVGKREYHATDSAVIELWRVGGPTGLDERDRLVTVRGECRPVTWTQDNEYWLGRE